MLGLNKNLCFSIYIYLYNNISCAIYLKHFSVCCLFPSITKISSSKTNASLILFLSNNSFKSSTAQILSPEATQNCIHLRFSFISEFLFLRLMTNLHNSS